MFNNLIQFHELLTKSGRIDNVYKAMENPDLAEVIMAILETLKQTKYSDLPDLNRDCKSEDASTRFRLSGNNAFKDKKYHEALTMYNKALLFAPKNSKAMFLAYSNRSALFHQVQAYSACLNDIQTSLSLDCPDRPLETAKKLKQRKEQVNHLRWVEKFDDHRFYTNYSDEFFHITRNPQIPCASTDVEVVVEKQAPKIVAASDVKVGTVLAVETAFVSHTDTRNAYFSCYYCHAMNLNLMPCNGCCYALFCNEDCRENCVKEYHSVECLIMDHLQMFTPCQTARLATRALLKIKHLCQNWRDLIDGSRIIGANRVKISTINHMYNSNHEFSLLNLKEERHFLNGPHYNAGLTCATIMMHLECIPNFYANCGDQKQEARRAVARLLMYLSLYSVPTQIPLGVSHMGSNEIDYHSIANAGWFSFIGKLKSSCIPNVIAVGLNKEIALIAVRPIKRGTELTISHIGHFLDKKERDKSIRARELIMYGIVCKCTICTDEYKQNDNYKLSEMQQKIYRKLNTCDISSRINSRNLSEIFPKVCKVLAFLADLPFSKEYADVYGLFRKCVLGLQDLVTKNEMLNTPARH